MVVAIVALSLGLGLIARPLYRIRQQRWIVGQIREAGGYVVFDYEFGRTIDPDSVIGGSRSVSYETVGDLRVRTRVTAEGELTERETPPGPKIIRHLFGNEVFANVDSVSLTSRDNKSVSQIEPQILLQLSRLKSVDIGGRVLY